MELDDAYANAAHIPGADAFPPRWTEQAQAFRNGLLAKDRAELGLPYGPSERQALDLFLPEGSTPAGLVVFVHGGYWLRFDRSFWSHLAQGALDRGYAVAMPSYDLCPSVDIPTITQQIARAVTFAANRVAGPILLTGHSAGGHLVARMTAPDMLPADIAARIEHVLPISPVADLRPLLRTSMNAQLGLDIATAEAESPALHQPPAVPVTVWVGAAERPAFVEQAQSLADAWGTPCIIEAERHHFDVIDGLLRMDSDMCRTLFATD